MCVRACMRACVRACMRTCMCVCVCVSFMGIFFFFQVVDYLLGNHDDVNCSGDRGDFYRRKLAEQIYINFGVHYITHDNVLNLVRDAIQLESDTRHALAKCGAQRVSAPSINVDSQVLDVLARIADMH